jgi:hypothetical protein
MFPAASAFFSGVSPILVEMDLSTLANLINAFAVTAGVIFAAAQIRHYRQRRQREAMLELVRSFQSPAFTSALRRACCRCPMARTHRKFEKMRCIWFRSLGKASVYCYFATSSPLIWWTISLAVRFFFLGRSFRFGPSNGVAS